MVLWGSMVYVNKRMYLWSGQYYCSIWWKWKKKTERNCFQKKIYLHILYFKAFTLTYMQIYDLTINGNGQCGNRLFTITIHFRRSLCIFVLAFFFVGRVYWCYSTLENYLGMLPLPSKDKISLVKIGISFPEYWTFFNIYLQARIYTETNEAEGQAKWRSKTIIPKMGFLTKLGPRCMPSIKMGPNELEPSN